MNWMGDVRRTMVTVIDLFPSFDDVGNADIMLLMMTIVTTGINTRAKGR